MADAKIAARRRLAMNARQTRERLGMTQEAAAERIDCAVPVLQRLERAVSAVTVDFLARVATAYRIDIAELFKETGAWERRPPGRPKVPAPKRMKRR